MAPRNKVAVVADVDAPVDGDGADVVIEAVEGEGGDEGQERQERPEREARPDPRAAIAARYREMRDADNDDNDDDADGGDAPVDGSDADDDGASKSAAVGPAVVPVDNSSREAPEDAEITLKVDGELVKMTVGEARNRLQQGAAADNRLETAKKISEEAKKASEEAKELLAQVKALSPGTAHQPSSDTGQKPDPSQSGTRPEHQPARVPDHEKFRGVAERIQVGDTDEGAKALVELIEDARKDIVAEMQRDRSANLTPEEFEKQVAEKVNAVIVEREDKAEIDKALSRFRSDHPEILNDPMLAPSGMVAVGQELLDAIRQVPGVKEEDLKPFLGNTKALTKIYQTFKREGHVSRGLDDIVDAAAKTLKKKFNIGVAPQPAIESQVPGKDPKIQTRIDTKRAAPQQPRSAGVRGALQQAAKPKSTSEILSDMRKARGQKVIA